MDRQGFAAQFETKSTNLQNGQDSPSRVTREISRAMAIDESSEISRSLRGRQSSCAGLICKPELFHSRCFTNHGNNRNSTTTSEWYDGIHVSYLLVPWRLQVSAGIELYAVQLRMREKIRDTKTLRSCMPKELVPHPVWLCARHTHEAA